MLPMLPTFPTFPFFSKLPSSPLLSIFPFFPKIPSSPMLPMLPIFHFISFQCFLAVRCFQPFLSFQCFPAVPCSDGTRVAGVGSQQRWAAGADGGRRQQQSPLEGSNRPARKQQSQGECGRRGRQLVTPDTCQGRGGLVQAVRSGVKSYNQLLAGCIKCWQTAPISGCDCRMHRLTRIISAGKDIVLMETCLAVGTGRGSVNGRLPAQKFRPEPPKP